MAKKSVAKNYIYNLIYQLLTIILPLITTPYLSRVLGAEPIGIYGYTLSIVTYFVLFGSLGIAMYGQREIAYVQNDKNKRSLVFWEIITVRTISLIVAMLLFYLVFCIKGEYAIYYRIFILYIVSNALDISWLLQGLEEFKKTVVRNIIVKTLSIILIFLFIKTPSDLWKYILIYVIAELLGNATMWMYLPKYIEKVKLKSLNLKKHIKPALILFIPQIATQIYTVLDKTMVGALTNDMNEVGFYEQAQKTVKSALTILTAYGTVMASRISNYYAQKQEDEIKNSIKNSFKLICFLGIPIVFGMIGIAQKFVPWFYGQGYEKVITLIITTSPIILFIGLSNIGGIQYLVPTGKQKEFTKSVTIGAISNVIFNIILIKFFKSTGAAIASVISEIVVCVVQYPYIKDIVNIKDILKISYKYFISGIIMLISIFMLQNQLSVSILNTVIEIIVGMIIYIAILIVIKDEYLIKQIKGVFKQK